MAVIHEGKKPFVCPICAQNFSNKNNMKSHVVSVHEKRRPFSCADCGKTFSDKRSSKPVCGILRLWLLPS